MRQSNTLHVGMDIRAPPAKSLTGRSRPTTFHLSVPHPFHCPDC